MTPPIRPALRAALRRLETIALPDGKRLLYAMPDGGVLRVDANPNRPLSGRPSSVTLDLRDDRGFRNYGWVGQAGPSGVRSILRDVAAEFPDAQLAVGPRVSGARAHTPGRRKGSIAEFDLTRLRPPGLLSLFE